VSAVALQPPSVRVEIVRPTPAISPLRSDIAGFIGPTHRGPIGVPTRVDGWRDYMRLFGDLDVRHDTTYAIRGYFENGGADAWIVRIAPEDTPTAVATWTTTALSGMPPSIAFIASSPGTWAQGLSLAITFRREGVRGRPEIDLFLCDADGDSEALVGLDAWDLPAELAERSVWLRCLPFAGPCALRNAGPRVATAELTLAIPPSFAAHPPSPIDIGHYLAALDTLGDVPEVALVCIPQAYDLGEPLAVAMWRYALHQADALRDRLVLVDLPASATQQQGAMSVADSVQQWLASTLGRASPEVPWRAGACYFPQLRVDDPLDLANRVRTLAPSGHVAGIISTLDRERGAHHTPAIEPMIGVLDLEVDTSSNDHAVLNEEGVHVLRCVPGRGFAMWGGRTLEKARDQRYVAHRRFLHRLVRAIRRVAEPLVFETNGPELWLQLVRGITGVLLEAWRSGALKGGRAEEAFRVQCDAETNPAEEIDAGRCLCRVLVAPATPMEFIVLRLALSRDGSLEVLA
jgi:uncharacterized protein